MLRAETQCLSMKQRIWKEKLMSAKRILRQERSLAKLIYIEQIAMGWPGLSAEVEVICAEIGIPNINVKNVDVKTINEAIFFSNYREMKEEMEDKSKLEGVRNEDFREVQEYMKDKAIENVRMAFRVRTKMVQKVKGNFKKLFKNNLLCEDCILRL